MSHDQTIGVALDDAVLRRLPHRRPRRRRSPVVRAIGARSSPATPSSRCSATTTTATTTLDQRREARRRRRDRRAAAADLHRPGLPRRRHPRRARRTVPRAGRTPLAAAARHRRRRHAGQVDRRRTARIDLRRRGLRRRRAQHAQVLRRHEPRPRHRPTTCRQSALAARLARMEAAGCTHALLEISSQALCQGKLAGVELDTVCGTTIDSARLDLHHTTQELPRRPTPRARLPLAGRRGRPQRRRPGELPLAQRRSTPRRSPTAWATRRRSPPTIVERNACETVFILTAGCESAAVRTTIVGDASRLELPGRRGDGAGPRRRPADDRRGHRSASRSCRPAWSGSTAVRTFRCSSTPPQRPRRCGRRCGPPGNSRRGRVICVLGDSLPADASRSGRRPQRRQQAGRRGDRHRRAHRRSTTSLAAATTEDRQRCKSPPTAAKRSPGPSPWPAQGDVVVIAGSRGRPNSASASSK